MSHGPDILIRSLRARMVLATRALVVLLQAIQACGAPQPCAPSSAKTGTPTLGRLVRTALGVSRQADKAFGRYRDLLLKRDMLRATEWRTRVLRELGGLRRLAAWDRTMKARIQREKSMQKSGRASGRGGPEAPQTLSPAERQMREAAQENRRAIAAIRAANNPHYVYVRVKGDRMGQFRLPPLARGPRETPETRESREQDVHRRMAGRRAMALSGRHGIEHHGTGPRTISGKHYLKERLVCVSPQDFRAAIFAERRVAPAFGAPAKRPMTTASPAHSPPLRPSLRGPPRQNTIR